MLVPPENCGLVEPGIYRCSKLDQDNFPFLETLNLKSIVIVDAEKPPGPLKRFIEANNVELFNLGALKISNHHHTGVNSSSGKLEEEGSSNGSTSSSGNADVNDLEPINVNTTKDKNDLWMLIEKNLILRAFELLLNKTKHNLLLVDSSLTLVGILRKIQKWNFNSIVNEYRTFAGTSTKNNYFAETFLELVEPELIAYEIHRFNSESKQPEKTLYKSPEFRRESRNASRTSVDDEASFDDRNSDTQSIDDDEMDDELLSASPQIPTNLLKLVELRKNDTSRDSEPDVDSVTPGSSPRYTRGSRNNSFTSDMIFSATRSNFERRRSSIDSLVRPSPSNIKFRQGARAPDRRAARDSFSKGSFSESLKEFKDSFKRPDDNELQQKYGFYYYKSFKENPYTSQKVNAIKIQLPQDTKLPAWFRSQRDYWEANFRKLNGLIE